MDGVKDDIVVRYTLPTRYDLAPMGTICKVERDAGNDFYVQTLDDATTAQWQSLGSVLLIVFEGFIKDPQFVQACLGLLKKSGERKELLTTISSIIKE